MATLWNTSTYYDTVFLSSWLMAIPLFSVSLKNNSAGIFLLKAGGAYSARLVFFTGKWKKIDLLKKHLQRNVSIFLSSLSELINWSKVWRTRSLWLENNSSVMHYFSNSYLFAALFFFPVFFLFRYKQGVFSI